MDVALASRLGRVGHVLSSTGVAQDARRSKLCSPKALPGHEALEVDHVPLIDLAQLAGSSSHDAARTKAALAKACHDWGFFQVVNHGVSQELVHSFRAQCREMFSLPLEQKMKAEREGASLYGYSFRPHTGPSEVLLVPGWDAPVIADYGRKLLYPRSAERFCAVFKEVNGALRKLAIRLLALVIEGLGVSPKQFEAYVEEAEGSIGARYYHRSLDEVVVGLHAHVDWNLISIVHQHEVGGLQVLKDQQWYSIPPRPDSYAINVGDCLQVLTNGKLRSVQHRVVTSKAEARLSIGYFLNPPSSATVVPVSAFVDSSHPPLYKPFTWRELVETQKRRPLLPSPLAHFEAK